MKVKTLVCCLLVAAVSASPAFAATKKKAAKKDASAQSGVVGGAVGTAGAVAAGAVGTAGAIVTAPFTMGPVSTLNGPTCKSGTTTTINGQKMRCQ
jgi:threonine/homoserine/homoserine lactone efflux protein